MKTAGSFEIITNSSEETFQAGRNFAKTLSPGNILAFCGDLAAGKTTFIKGIITAMTTFPVEQINSPTFIYLNLYESSKTIYHFDLYRLKNSDDFLDMGFDEYLFSDGICCIEWAERIQDIIPPHAIVIHMIHLEKNQRQITIQTSE